MPRWQKTLSISLTPTRDLRTLRKAIKTEILHERQQKQLSGALAITLLALSIVAACPARAETDLRWELYANARSITLSESTAAYDLAKDFEQFNGKGDTAFTHNQFEAGATLEKGSNHFGIAWLTRYDYNIQYTTDTAELVYLDNNDLPTDPGRNFTIHLAAHHLRSAGVKFSFSRQINKTLHAGASVSWLQTSDLTDGIIDGTLSIDEQGDFTGDAMVQYAYHHDQLFDRVSDGTSGDGYSVDLNLSWHPINALHIDFNVYDAFSEVNWDQAAFTQARVNSATTSLNNDGLLDVNPVLSGVEGYADHKQTLPPRSTLRTAFSVTPKWSIVGEAFNVNSTTLLQLGGHYQLNTSSFVEFTIDTQTNALRLKFANRIFNVGLLTDSIDLNEAQHVGLELGLALQF